MLIEVAVVEYYWLLNNKNEKNQKDRASEAERLC